MLPATAQVRTAPSRPTRTSSDDRRVHGDHPVLPARLRGHRALRRRVRHLQHALDHGRAADARVRDAAHARRVAPAGARLGDPRGARDRPRRLDRRSLPRPRARRGAERALRGARARPAAGRDGVRRRGRSSSRCSSGRSSRCVAGLFPAVRATRVPPIAAVREGATLPQSRFARFTPYSRPRSWIGCRSRCSATAPSPTASGPATGFCSARRRRPRAVPRRRDALARGSCARSPRSSACPRGASAARPDSSREGTRCATRAGRLDRRRAHDRARARHVRRRARAGPARSRRGGRASSSSADYVLTSQDGFIPLPAAGGRRGPRAGRRDRHRRPPGPRRGRRRRRDVDRRRPDDDRRGAALRLGAGLGRGARRGSATTAPSLDDGLRRGPRPRGRDAVRLLDGRRRDEATSSSRHLRAADLLPVARPGQHLAARRSTRSTSGREPVHVRQRAGAPSEQTTRRSRARSPTSRTRKVQTAAEFIDEQDEEPRRSSCTCSTSCSRSR